MSGKSVLNCTYAATVHLGSCFVVLGLVTLSCASAHARDAEPLVANVTLTETGRSVGDPPSVLVSGEPEKAWCVSKVHPDAKVRLVFDQPLTDPMIFFRLGRSGAGYSDDRTVPVRFDVLVNGSEPTELKGDGPHVYVHPRGRVDSIEISIPPDGYVWDRACIAGVRVSERGHLPGTMFLVTGVPPAALATLPAAIRSATRSLASCDPRDLHFPLPLHLGEVRTRVSSAADFRETCRAKLTPRLDSNGWNATSPHVGDVKLDASTSGPPRYSDVTLRHDGTRWQIVDLQLVCAGGCGPRPVTGELEGTIGPAPR